MNDTDNRHTTRLLCVPLLLALILGMARSPRSQEIIRSEPGLFVTSEIVKELSHLPQNRLDIQAASSLAGSLTIGTSESPSLKVTFVKKARTTNRSRAFDYIDLMSLNLSEAGDRAKLIMRAPNPGTWEKWSESGRIDAVIIVPANCFIEIEAAAFDVNATGPLRGLVIPASLGKIRANDVSGVLQIKTANQKVDIENIVGQCSAVTSNAPLLARSIQSTKETARFRNSQGEIKIIDFEGALKVRNDLGRIEIIGFVPGGDANFISGSSAPISVDIVTMQHGQIVINNRNEDIEISVPDNLDAWYYFSVGDNGAIDAASIPVRTELIRPGKMNLVSGQGGVDISGTIRGEGNIYLRGIEP